LPRAARSTRNIFWQVTRSNDASGNGNASALACWTVTRAGVLPRALSGSMPTTERARQLRNSVRVQCPAPQPTSRTVRRRLGKTAASREERDEVCVQA
jgi:hypothetical protein